MIQKRFDKPRSWILTSVLAAGALAYAFFMFLPGQRAIHAMQDELKQKQQVIAQSGQLTPAIQQASDELAATHQFVDQWRADAPNESKLAAVFGGISDLARQAGVTLEHVEPQPRIRLETIGQAPVTIQCRGDFLQVAEFLDAIENLPSTVWVTELELTPASDRPELARPAAAGRIENEDSPISESGGNVQCKLTVAIFADNHDFSE